MHPEIKKIMISNSDIVARCQALAKEIDAYYGSIRLSVTL